MNELISVIILNYNGREYLDGCLSSVLKQTYRPVSVILVDNGSTDGSIELVREKYPGVIVVENKSNLGFSGGNNVGVEKADSDLVVLLNNDVTVPENWLEELYGGIQSGADIADSTIMNEGMPEEFFRKNGTLSILGQNIPMVFEKENRTFYASGCSLIYRKKKLGLPFDKDYFAYGEDIYFGWKSRMMGKKIVHCPGSVVMHFASGTTRNLNRGKITFFQERNRLLNLFIFYELKNLVKLFPLLLLELPFRLLWVFASSRKSIFGWIRAVMWMALRLPTVIRKRKAIQKNRVSKDDEIIKWMTCKIIPGKGFPAAFINNLSKLYCFLFRIRTYELQ